MPHHTEELDLPVPQATAHLACHQAAADLGWTSEEQGEGRLLVKEKLLRLAAVATYPVHVDILLIATGPATTHVTLAGSIFGLGPLQSGHLKERVRSLRARLEQVSPATMGAPMPVPPATMGAPMPVPPATMGAPMQAPVSGPPAAPAVPAPVAPVDAPAVPAPVAPVGPSAAPVGAAPATVYCMNCGAPSPVGTSFCRQCGTRFPAAQ